MFGIDNLFSKGAGEVKASQTSSMIAMTRLGQPYWSRRDTASLVRNGYEKNAIVYRCVRLISEAAASAPMRVLENGALLNAHPLLALLTRPNADQSGTELLENFYGYLQTAGNAYLEAVSIDGDIRELFALRPDRIKIKPGGAGWPEAYEYSVGERKTVFRHDGTGLSPVMHLKLFNPGDDQYGLSPLHAALSSIDLHNAASSWNKALLDNAARPSGAIVYKGPEGAENLTAEQFGRIKSELEENFQGAANAGRPLVLDGGLDWRAMSLSPTEMNFIEAKNMAAREIALALGVPPMLLGIPGDNTYSNYREANLAFWKQTVLPLVRKTAAALSAWVSPVYPDVSFECQSCDIDALSAERDALWDRVTRADFLTDDEKRRLVGVESVNEVTS